MSDHIGVQVQPETTGNQTNTVHIPTQDAPTKKSKKEAENSSEEAKSDTESEDENNMLANIPNEAFGYRTVDEVLKEAYNFKESNCSMICDIMVLYLKGQRMLYTEAKTLCEQRLNYLMLPTICITAVCAVISVVLKEYAFSSTIVSSLNGLNFFFLTLINYLKLDAKAEAHRVSAYKFDKIQAKLEFKSGTILFIVGEARQLPQLISETEKEVREIKETNQFLLPESIRLNYPLLYSTNLFSEVKKVQSKETVLVNKLKDTLNESVKVKFKIQNKLGNQKQNKKRLLILEEKNKMLTNKIISIKDKYLEIDHMFDNEIKIQRMKLSKRYQLCGCLKT